jgi:glycosyltransferase involved in cell wall biosynthesis
MGPTVALYPAPADREVSAPSLSRAEWAGRHAVDLRSVGSVKKSASLPVKFQMVLQRSFPDGACLPIEQLAEMVRQQVNIRCPTAIWFDMPSTFPVRRRINMLDISTIGCCQDSSSLLLKDAGKASSGMIRLRKRIRLCLVKRAERDLKTVFKRLVFLTSRDAAATLGESFGLQSFIIPLAASQSCFSLKICPDEKPLLVFVGTSTYWPNADAVSWLCSDLFPALRQVRPDVRLRLAGRGPWPKALGANVTVLSDFDNLGQAFEGAWAAVAPVRFGAGMQNKVLEAVAAGVPIIAHDHALRGADDLSTFVWQFLDRDGFVKQTLDCLGMAAAERENRIAQSRAVAAKTHSPAAEESAFRRAIIGLICND